MLHARSIQQHTPIYGGVSLFQISLKEMLKSTCHKKNIFCSSMLSDGLQEHAADLKHTSPYNARLIALFSAHDTNGEKQFQLNLQEILEKEKREMWVDLGGFTPWIKASTMVEFCEGKSVHPILVSHEGTITDTTLDLSQKAEKGMLFNVSSSSFYRGIGQHSFLSHRCGDPSKNSRMLLNAASTRYSLVKGERIVLFVLTAQLREVLIDTRSHSYFAARVSTSFFFRCGNTKYRAHQSTDELCLVD
ncbi:hypothetical protein LguiA_005172 [Lonicera macranthoides]